VQSDAKVQVLARALSKFSEHEPASLTTEPLAPLAPLAPEPTEEPDAAVPPDDIVPLDEPAAAPVEIVLLVPVPEISPAAPALLDNPALEPVEPASIAPEWQHHSPCRANRKPPAYARWPRARGLRKAPTNQERHFLSK
jgi:hypothetical protein